MSEVLVQGLDESSSPCGTVERRAWVRFPTRLKGACQPIPLPHAADPESQWRGKVVNLSASGLCLHLVRRFEPGTPLIFELPNPTGASSWMLTGRVARIAPSTGADWALGCQFDIPLTAEQLKALLDITGTDLASAESKDHAANPYAQRS
jgi:hypothetical protein